METNEKKWCVYIHRNMVNNKAYIGITSQRLTKRWGNGTGYGDNQPVFHMAIQKYGWDNFEHIIWADNLSEDKAKHLEMILIALFKTNCSKYKNPVYGYNMTDGGDGATGRTQSEETRALLSRIHTERMKNPKIRENLRQKAKEQMSNPHMIVQLSRLKQGVYNGDKNPMYGKKHTDEAKQRISQKMKERLKNPENNGMYGRGKRVVQLTFDGEYVDKYISADEAGKITGINRSGIRRCCHHQAKSAGGFVWLFEEEYNQTQ